MTEITRALPLRSSVERSELGTLSTGGRVRRGAKRAFDIVAAGAGLVLVSPVLLVLAVMVRLDSPGPAVFRQTRIGVGGRRFRIVKFRTMVVDAEAQLAGDATLRQLYEAQNFKLAIDEDPRITKIGRFLRHTSLDELPQLWNVLRGEMSLVGVRPVPDDHYEAFGPAQWAYNEMRPGISGLWQVNGRNLASMAESNVYYIENWSLRLDARILLKTLPTVLKRHGAY